MHHRQHAVDFLQATAMLCATKVSHLQHASPLLLLPHLVDISIANNTPPTAALNAVHTPHAAPHAQLQTTNFSMHRHCCCCLTSWTSP
jgi:hypothetical protein